MQPLNPGLSISEELGHNGQKSLRGFQKTQTAVVADWPQDRNHRSRSAISSSGPFCMTFRRPIELTPVRTSP